MDRPMALTFDLSQGSKNSARRPGNEKPQHVNAGAR
jgi:hypothetical protein